MHVCMLHDLRICRQLHAATNGDDFCLWNGYISQPYRWQHYDCVHMPVHCLVRYDMGTHRLGERLSLPQYLLFQADILHRPSSPRSTLHGIALAQWASPPPQTGLSTSSSPFSLRSLSTILISAMAMSSLDAVSPALSLSIYSCVRAREGGWRRSILCMFHVCRLGGAVLGLRQRARRWPRLRVKVGCSMQRVCRDR